MTKEVELHCEYENMQKAPASLLRHELGGRRKLLLQKVAAIQTTTVDMEACEWSTRSYPVLSILAPVMSTTEGKVEYPGDPMCLYSALSYAIDQAVSTRQMGICEDAPYNDLCPQWGCLPSAEYRAQADVNG